MRIIDVKLPKGFPSEDGLDTIEMDRLGQLVLLAGRNGSGKSRLLEKIAQAFRVQVSTENIPGEKASLNKAENDIRRFDQKLALYNNPHFDPTSKGEVREARVAGILGMKKRAEETAIRKRQILSRIFLKIDGDAKARHIVHFVPKQLNLQDPKELNPKDLERRAKEANSIPVQKFNESVLPKIQDLHNQYWNATHQKSRLSQVEKDAISSEYERLQANISQLLGSRLGEDSRGAATLFNFPIGEAKLSDGQKILLQMAVAIHCQGAKVSNSILLLDEPENHIHPGAIIEAIESLLKNTSNGQIWIATHSLSLLGHFSDQGSLWYMDDGKVSPVGKIQEKVLRGLLGDEARIARQREFLEKPETVALNRYAKQCLCPPAVVMTGSDDPQVAQIRKIIDALYEKHGVLKVLDFGAGKGRLLANLAEDAGSVEQIATKINYVAYDSSLNDRETCESHIVKVYKNHADRWFGNYNDLLGPHNKGSFHLVLMCNVLHEIPPNAWNKLFGPNGEITELLSDDGYLLLVEDQRIPVGENAHKYGFIVLDTAALKDLFAVNGDVVSIVADSQRNGRLKAHLVPKTDLKRVTSETKDKALHTHRQHAAREIKRIRDDGATTDGRLHAFWLVQYANVTLAIDDNR